MKYERLTGHKRNEELEKLLKEINQLLNPVESKILSSFGKNKYPIILILGSPRSGTTLFLQWLASLGCFGYPTNILSRFYEAPYLGAKIQLMLLNNDFNNEIYDLNEVNPFQSVLGKTKGALSPNEFWYFWRRFFHFGEIQKLTDNELQLVNSSTFVSEIAALEQAFGKPFAMKGMILNWNISYLKQILDKVLFVHIKRNPIYNAQSLLKARLDYYGDMRAWYSFKPPEYPDLVDLDPFEQVCGQIFFTNNAVEEGLAAIPNENKLSISYEEFCAAPAHVFLQIREKYMQQGHDLRSEYNGPHSFNIGNSVTLPDADMLKLREVYKSFSGELFSYEN